MKRKAWSAVALLAAGLLAAPLLSGWIAEPRTPSFHRPAGWPAPRYDFADNPVTPAGFALGRQLFYEPRLSRDGSVSCGSCHQQFAGFAHFDHRVSHGVGGVNGLRNAPGLANLAWQPELMWDGAVRHLELQPLAPLANPLEMGSSLEAALAFLRSEPGYRQRFAAAFGSADIDSQRLLRALAQFTGTLISADTRYDRFVAGDYSALGDAEKHGLQLFRQHCAACHAEPLFSDFSYRSNGLDAAPHDAGRATISQQPQDFGRFRVPSLRNVALTAPYMHDGRYETLEQVLDHYQHGIAPGADPRLAAGLPDLGPGGRQALLAFLVSLSDERFLTDPRFAEPAALVQ